MTEPADDRWIPSYHLHPLPLSHCTLRRLLHHNVLHSLTSWLNEQFWLDIWALEAWGRAWIRFYRLEAFVVFFHSYRHDIPPITRWHAYRSNSRGTEGESTSFRGSVEAERLRAFCMPMSSTSDSVHVHHKKNHVCNRIGAISFDGRRFQGSRRKSMFASTNESKTFWPRCRPTFGTGAYWSLVRMRFYCHQKVDICSKVGLSRYHANMRDMKDTRTTKAYWYLRSANYHSFS